MEAVHTQIATQDLKIVVCEKWVYFLAPAFRRAVKHPGPTHPQDQGLDLSYDLH